MGRPGLWEIVIIALIIMVLFGAKKLPEFARYLGQAFKEFKKVGKGIKDDVNEVIEDNENERKT